MSELRVVRTRVRVAGTVQGVGFRPYVYRLARELGVAGFVLNDERGVLVEAEGDAAAVEALLERLPTEAPPLAAVESVAETPMQPLGARGFEIVASQQAGTPDAFVTPDGATCDDCLAELFDPADRRFRYPFVNCTNCGPRFTIVTGVPYDRPSTTMAGFTMCARCQAEYDDPADRRFHAQPNACPDCGPSLRIAPTNPPPPRRTASDALAHAAAALRAGDIVAVKGIGGYHLACLSADDAAVTRLRGRKHREDRPFALMVGDVGAAQVLVELDAGAEALLCSRERPIVVAPRRPDAPVAAAVAPRSADLGVMLPYSPLHHLLLHDIGAPLVMTSGNVSDEPIAYADDDALERLAPIADLVLLHDRPIHLRTDDSVVRPSRAGPILLRRSRGHVPASVSLPIESPPLLACGAELKSTFCLARGRRAWVGHHIGDLRNWETLRSYREGVAHFERLFSVEPKVVAHDLHPDYLSTTYAHEREGVRLVGVQHHHAHLAACLAEHGEVGPAVGAIFDGSGFGTDGTVWGGELLLGDLRDFERVGHLHPVALPGGDRAVHEPWRMACAWMVAAGQPVDRPPPALAGAVDAERWRAVAALAGAERGRPGAERVESIGDSERRGLAPTTTSMGRLFDAVAVLAGLRSTVTHEGQAAMELEAVADPAERGAYPVTLQLEPRPLVLDARPAIAAILAERAPAATIAARFHNALADATAAACTIVARERGVEVVVLSGGVFQNRRLLERTHAAVRAAGLRVLVPMLLPPNDGGIALGQAAVAAAREDA